MKDIIKKIEAVPKSQRLSYYGDDLEQLIEAYAPNYPNSMTTLEFARLCNGLFAFGVLRGRRYEQDRRRRRRRA